MSGVLPLGDEVLDYLRELMNIGAGNAAGALSELLHRPVTARRPELYVCALPQVATVIGHPDTPRVGLRMHLSGDVRGSMFLLLMKSDSERLLELAAGGNSRDTEASKDAILRRLGLDVSTVYLDAVDRFCGLKTRGIDAQV